MSKERIVNNISSNEAMENALKFVETDGGDHESDINCLVRDDSGKWKSNKLIKTVIIQTVKMKCSIIVESFTNIKQKRKGLLIKYYSRIIDSEFKQNFIYQKKKIKITELFNLSSKKRESKKNIIFV